MNKFRATVHFKVQSFSLIELMVVLMISGLIISLIYGVLHRTSAGFMQFKRSQEQLMDIEFFEQHLHHVFRESFLVYYQDKQLYFYPQGNYEEKIAVFDITSQVLETKNSVDTLHQTIVDYDVFFQHESIKELDNMAVDEFHMQLDVKEEDIYLVFDIPYVAAQLMTIQKQWQE